MLEVKFSGYLMGLTRIYKNVLFTYEIVYRKKLETTVNCPVCIFVFVLFCFSLFIYCFLNFLLLCLFFVFSTS